MEERIRPRTQQSRNSRRAYLKRRRRQDLTIKIAIFVILIASVIGGAFLIKKFGPSKEMVKVDKYYGIENENQLAIIVDNEVVGAKGMLYDGNPYVEYAVVRDYLNGRFYLDVNENILLYTLSDGTIRVDVGSKDYTLQKETKSKDYVILKMEGSADGEFTITIEDRIVEGRAKARIVQMVNEFIDANKTEILEIWDKAQRGERITKINR